MPLSTPSPSTASGTSTRRARRIASGRLSRERAADLSVRFVLGDELVGDIVEVVANDMRLGTDAKNVVADTFDQRRFPARGNRAKRVPGVTGDHAELGGLRSELFLDIGVSLP